MILCAAKILAGVWFVSVVALLVVLWVASRE